VTAKPESAATTAPPSPVGELLQSLTKALRAFQMYLPNNPIYQRAIGNVRNAFGPVWQETDVLELQVVETDFVRQEETVYRQPNKAESLAWWLFKDGMRSLTLQKGVEQEEIVRLLETINRARFLPTDAGDDLLTLLWEREFSFIKYQFAEAFSDEVVQGLGGETGAHAAAADDAASDEQRKALAQEDAPPKPPGVVDIDDFDSTLYFLDEVEIQYIAREVAAEYHRDARASALSALFDIFEAQPAIDVRSEIIGVVEHLFPNLLNQGELRAAAGVLREARKLATATPDLDSALRKRLDAFDAQLSQPDIVRQLVQALDEASARPDDADVVDLLRELRASALEPIVIAIPLVGAAGVRTLLEAAADRLAQAHPTEVLRLLRTPATEALAGIVAICGRLQLQAAVPGLGETVVHADPAVRLATVLALHQVGSPGALQSLERAIDDEDRGVRLAAVRAAMQRGYKGALKRVENVVLDKAVRDLDLTEKLAFFEAYGAIAGPSALKTLDGLLHNRGLLRYRADPETRACAAVAIGRIRTPEARDVLQRAADDKELKVRNAVSRALREPAP
jgi:HEAT repeat protein